jgi:cytochrome c-type biogenesis protein CcmH/NrfF
LSTCSCSDADTARERVRAKMKAGETRDQILADWVTEYGTDAVTVPPNTGAFRVVWLLPVVGIVIGGLGLARMVRRWRRPEAAVAGAAKAPETQGADAYDSRLDDELKDLDV